MNEQRHLRSPPSLQPSNLIRSLGGICRLPKTATNHNRARFKQNLPGWNRNNTWP